MNPLHALSTGAAPLVVGSLNLDHHLLLAGPAIPDGSVEVLEYRTSPGGHAGNCAVAMTSFVRRPALMSVVGDDEVGRRLRNEISSRGVDTDQVTVLADKATGQVFIPYHGRDSAMLMHRAATTAWPPSSAPPDVAPFSGTVLFDAPGHVRTSLIASCRAASLPYVFAPGGVVVEDPTIHRAAEGAALVVLNRPEFQQLFSHDVTDRGLRTACRSLGSRNLVVTLGPDGASGSDGRDIWREPGRPVSRFVDATGAGDAFIAAASVALFAGESLRTAMRWGNVAGAVCVGEMGARLSARALAEIASQISDLSAA